MFSRRKFLKSAAIGSTAILGAGMFSGCSPSNQDKVSPYIRFTPFKGKGYNLSDGVAGLLFSQIGYEPDFPVRVVVRLPKSDLLAHDAECQLLKVDGKVEHKTPCSYWGEIWGSHWWVAEFSPLQQPGEWDVAIVNKGETVLLSSGLKVEKDILWNSSVEWSTADMLERRAHFTNVGSGWQDAGALWVESCSQSAMVLGLLEVLESADRLNGELLDRIYKQLTVGCDYLVLTQKKARELGFPEGAMSHDVLGHEKDILPHDASKAFLALWKTSLVLPELYEEKKPVYREAAEKTFSWLSNKARPMGDYGMSKLLRGLSDDALIPQNEWQTRDLVLFLWGTLERYKTTKQGKERCVELTKQILARQITKENAEGVFYGHFREFDSLPHSEKSWTHGIVRNEFGADIGGFYPNYLIPVIEMLRIWPDHEDAPLWEEMLRNFAYGYLIPGCSQNPFFIVPQGIFGDEGAIWFCGTFHGTNTIYGYTAALAMELSTFFNEPALRSIAYGNLQWLAGLNAGITAESLNSSAAVIFSYDVPEGVALPASMMCGVGNRWAGTWFGTRGVICNGFSTGKQFHYDTAPLKANDGPFAFTDEDWIPHSAAWLTGLVRLK